MLTIFKLLFGLEMEILLLISQMNIFAFFFEEIKDEILILFFLTNQTNNYNCQYIIPQCNEISFTVSN